MRGPSDRGEELKDGHTNRGLRHEKILGRVGEAVDVVRDRRMENGESAAELTPVKLARFPWEIGPGGPGPLYPRGSVKHTTYEIRHRRFMLDDTMS